MLQHKQTLSLILTRRVTGGARSRRQHEALERSAIPALLPSRWLPAARMYCSLCRRPVTCRGQHPLTHLATAALFRAPCHGEQAPAFMRATSDAGNGGGGGAKGWRWLLLRMADSIAIHPKRAQSWPARAAPRSQVQESSSLCVCTTEHCC